MAEPQLVFTGEDEADAGPTAIGGDGADSTDEVQVDEVLVGDFVPSAPADVDETQAMPWRPVFDETDDLSGLLQADSPLLSRAFRGVARDDVRDG